MSKLTPEQREEMLRRYAAGVPPHVLTCEYGIGATTIERERQAAGLPRHRAADFAPLLPVLGTIRLTSRPVPSGSMPPSCFEEVPDGQP